MTPDKRLDDLRESIYHGTYTVAAMRERGDPAWRDLATDLRRQRKELRQLKQATAVAAAEQKASAANGLTAQVLDAVRSDAPSAQLPPIREAMDTLMREGGGA